MRQPKFLRHLVEKFLLKGDEGNANLHSGIMPCWDMQPIGVTRLPEVPCKISEVITTDGTLSFQTTTIEEPVHFSHIRNQTTNFGEQLIVTDLPVGTIFRWITNVCLEDEALTGPITIQRSVFRANTINRIYQDICRFNAGCVCPLTWDTGWLYSQFTVDLGIGVATINPVGQTVVFSSQLCLYPNRELC